MVDRRVRLADFVVALRPIGWGPPLFALVFGIIDAGVNNLLTCFLLFLCFGPLLVGSGYVINFMSDAEVDRKSNVVKDIVMANQPFATGKLTTRQGVLLAVGLATAGLAIAWLINPSVFAVGCSLLLMGVVYSYPPRLKEVLLADVVANALIVTICYVAGWVAFKPIIALSPYPVVWLFFLVSSTYLLTVLIDIEPDRESGVRTTAVCLGESRAIKLASSLYLVSFVFYIISAITLQRISYYLVSAGLIWAIRGFLKRVRKPEPSSIYKFGKKATLAAGATVLIIGTLYTILFLLGLEMY